MRRLLENPFFKLAAGVLLGAAFGYMLGNISLGIGIGFALGIGYGFIAGKDE